MEWLIWVGIAVLVGGIAYLSYYLKKKRLAELKMMAAQLGLEFWGDDIEGLLLHPFSLFRRGDGRGIENVMRGQWQGIALRQFDYWYYEESTDSDGNTSRSYSYFSCALGWIDAACSPITIGRENLLTRIADHMGMPDIEFELEEFNHAFNVKGKDRKFAFDFIDARMMRWLLDAGSEFEYEVVGNELLVFSKRRRPTELIPLLGTLKGFREQVPRVVYELYPAPGAGLPPSPPSPGMY